MVNHNPLNQFGPGNNANPNGRPKKEWTMASLIRNALEEQNASGVPKKVTIARKLAELADAGDITAIKEVNNRLDGMPAQSIKQTHDGSVNVIIRDYGSEHHPPTETEGGDTEE